MQNSGCGKHRKYIVAVVVVVVVVVVVFVVVVVVKNQSLSLSPPKCKTACINIEST